MTSAPRLDIRFHNTLTRREERFEPLAPPTVTMYSCGPTVYDYAHIGNFRTFLFSDVLRRFLEAAGHDVTQVMNITDVGHMTEDDVADGGGEDKMVAAARRLKEQKKADKKSGTVAAGLIEDPDDPYQVAGFYADAFLEDARTLGLAIAFDPAERRPRATENVPGMLEMIDTLVDKGHAYVASDGVVYFSVESFPDYGRLSGNSLEELREGLGGRVSAEDQRRKRHPADFMLWKPDPTHVMRWPSRYGEGYPGWHVECSVMAKAFLGRDVIDIHTGGEDLVFPHHECEIAQSRCTTGREAFARFWMHARFLLVEGKKMSKSDGTFFTVRDVLEGRATNGTPVHPALLRYELIRTHYRSNLNFTGRGLETAAGAVRKLVEFEARLREAAKGEVAPDAPDDHPVLAEFLGCLADDLNVSGALGAVFPWVSSCDEDPREALAVLRRIDHVLNVAPLSAPDGTPIAPAGAGAGDDRQAEADELCRALDAARAAKDYARADELRASIIALGFEVKTGTDGTVATPALG